MHGGGEAGHARANHNHFFMESDFVTHTAYSTVAANKKSRALLSACAAMLVLVASLAISFSRSSSRAVSSVKP